MTQTLILTLLLSYFIALKSEEISEQRPNCHISVVSVAKSGKSSKQLFQLVQKDQVTCQKAGAVHENNFAPNFVETKTVTVEWTGSKK